MRVRPRAGSAEGHSRCHQLCTLWCVACPSVCLICPSVCLSVCLCAQLPCQFCRMRAHGGGACCASSSGLEHLLFLRPNSIDAHASAAAAHTVHPHAD